MASASILVVDDDAALCCNLKDILSEEGYDVTVATSGQAAIEACSKKTFDLALVDLGLPDLPGIEVIDRLAERSPTTEFIVITGQATLESAITAAKSPMVVSYELKPISINYVLALLEQVVSRREAVAALADSERRLKDAQAQGKIGYWEFGVNDQAITWSDETYRLYERDPALGPPSVAEETSYYTAEQRTTLQGYTERALSSGEAFEYDIEATLPDKGPVWFAASMRPIKDGSGRVTRLFGTVQDITKRKLAEESLAASQAQLQAIFDNSRDGIAIVDEERTILDCNDAYADILGYGAEELKGLDYRDLTPQEFAAADEKAVEQLMGQGHFDEYEKELIRKGGQPVPVSIRGARTRGKPGDAQWEAFAVIRDVTERKQSARTFWQWVFESVSDGVVVTNLDGEVTDMNDRAVELGRSGAKSDLLGKRFVETVAARDRDRVLADIREIVGGSGGHTAEYVLVKADGSEYVAEISANLMSDSTGNPTGIVSVIRDVTERRSVEDEVRRYEARLRSYLENAPDAVYTVDLDGVLLYGNAKAEEISGYRKDELIGKSFRDLGLLSEGHLDKASHLLSRSRAGEATGPEEFELIRKDGSRVWVEINTVPIEERDRTVVVAFVRDFTERTLAESALEKSQLRYTTLVNNAHFGVFRSTPGPLATFLEVNPAMEQITGYSREDLLAMDASDLYPYPEERAAFSEDLIGESGQVTAEVWLKRKDGELRLVRHLVTSVRDEEGELEYFHGIMEDVTERRQMEEERKEIERKAILAGRLASIGEMASGIAHEVNNPLGGILGFADLLLESNLTAAVREDVTVIRQEAQRVSSIVRKLLTFASRQGPEREYVDVNEIVVTTIALRDYELKTRNIDVVTHLQPDLPWTMADGGQLQQVFLNLILNAEAELRQGTGKGIIEIATEAVDARTLRVSFKDNGRGIASENLERIFEPFFSTRKASGGTGLGLSVCHGIVSEHGGGIYVESVPGEGATLIVELPIVAEERQSKLPVSDAVGATETVLGRVLVVDDEPTMLRFVVRVLEQTGHEVSTAANSQEAMQLIKDNEFDLILLDIRLSEMNGKELHGHLRRMVPDSAKKVMFITGDIKAQDTRAFLSRTKTPYITKPIAAERLRREVSDFLRRQG